MTLITAHEASALYHRHPAWLMTLQRMGLLTPKKLCPVTYDADELEAFMRRLDGATIRKVNAFLRTPKNPALPEPRRGRRPGSGSIEKGDQKTAPGSVAGAGVTSPARSA